MPEGRVYRVGITGSYGGLNLGDEAILKGIISQLRGSLDVEITVFSRNAEDTLERHRVEHAVPVRSMTRKEVVPHLAHLDLLILGGGGILFDGEAGNFLREVELALQQNIPVMAYAVSAGPLEDPRSQRLVRDCLDRCKLVTVRERTAKKLLEDIGVQKEIEVTADPALLLAPEEITQDALLREDLVGDRRLVGMSVREPGSAAPHIKEEHYHRLLADAADFMVDRFDADVLFVPMERKVRDVPHSHAVISKMLRASRAQVLRGHYSSSQILWLMHRFSFAVGMRLHFLIFAALQAVPFVALPYSSKVEGFLEDLEIGMPPIELVSAGRLIAHIDHWWDNKDSLSRKIRNAVPELQQRARRTNQLAVELLTGKAGSNQTGGVIPGRIE
jgi:polysaccharide pyruvyl transferase CsaB